MATSTELRPPRSTESIPAYTEEQLVIVDDKYFLIVDIGKRAFKLPVVNISSTDQTSGIAWLSIDRERNPVLAQAASEEFARLFINLRANTIIMPSSSKSEWAIKQGKDLMQITANEWVKLWTMPGGTDKATVENLSEPGSVREYTPVTGIKKYMGMPAGLEERILQENGKRNIVLVDDVYNTGNTMNKMREVTGLVEGRENVFQAVLARESLLSGNYPPKLKPRMSTSFFLPEFVGLPPKNLYSIEDAREIPIEVI